MKTLATKTSTVSDVRFTRLITLRAGENPTISFDRETVTVVDDVPVESTRRDRQQFELSLGGKGAQEVDLNGTKYTVAEILSALEQLADDTEDKAVADAAAKAAEVASAVSG